MEDNGRKRKVIMWGEGLDVCAPHPTEGNVFCLHCPSSIMFSANNNSFASFLTSVILFFSFCTPFNLCYSFEQKL